MSLPKMVYADGIHKNTRAAFGGYNHTAGASDGEIFDMENMSSDDFPVLSSRAGRYLVCELTGNPNGLYARDGLLYVDGTGVYADGERVGTVKNSRKVFASLGMVTVILPDKKYYNRLTGEFGSLEAMVTADAFFEDGTYAGEAAAGNTLRASGVDFTSYFKPGDAVRLSGSKEHPENNKVSIIREIDGDKLRFYENAFCISGEEAEEITVSREVPDMDFICENDNRLWGCKGDEIYACKLGDAFNWNVFDGLSTDSYAVTVGSAGDFTGCIGYLGYPLFFKEQQIYKVYGDKPANFQVMGSATMGLAAGSSGSLAVAGEVLYYLSPVGICAYTGGLPQSLALPFGAESFKNAVGGSDGLRYFVCMENSAGEARLFVYDTRHRVWMAEDRGLRIIDFGSEPGGVFLDDGGRIYFRENLLLPFPDSVVKEDEAALRSMVEFGDFVFSSPDRKGISKIQVRLETDAGSRVEVMIRYDSGDGYEPVASLTAESKRSFLLPVIPRRCDHFRLKFCAVGKWKLYSLSVESYEGSGL